MKLKTRFEILKRDGFRCRYCGADQTKSLLQVDHVHPKAKGGGNHESNLVTACFECNQGKKDRPLLPIPQSAAEVEYAEDDAELDRNKELDSILGLLISRFGDNRFRGFGYDCDLPPEIAEWAHIVRSAGIGEWISISVILNASDELIALTSSEMRTVLQQKTLTFPGFARNCYPAAEKLRSTWPRLRVVE